MCVYLSSGDDACSFCPFFFQTTWGLGSWGSMRKWQSSRALVPLSVRTSWGLVSITVRSDRDSKIQERLLCAGVFIYTELILSFQVSALHVHIWNISHFLPFININTFHTCCIYSWLNSKNNFQGEKCAQKGYDGSLLQHQFTQFMKKHSFSAIHTQSLSLSQTVINMLSHARLCYDCLVK